jgi:phospholipid-binding lipoprotein MlaA
MNRFAYRFNARLDESIVLPVTDQYRRLPSPLRAGAHNFFANLREVMSTLNYVAQLRLAPGARSLGRFVINSTPGIGGLFDVATAMKIPSAPTGFGATLARWGMHPGPYFVIPFLGPNTVRDGVGWGVDFGTGYIINVADLYQGTIGWYLLPVGLLDLRASVDYRYYATGSPFEYDNIRFLYVRKTLIEDDAARMWHRRGNANAQTPAGK